jgi:lysozyme
MAFNLGSAKLCAFHRMIEALSEGDFDEAATQMLNSRWAEQVGHRAIKLAQMMRYG